MYVAVVWLLAAICAVSLVSILPWGPRWMHGMTPAVVSIALCTAALICGLGSTTTSTAEKFLLAGLTLGAATSGGWPVTEAVLHIALKIPMRVPSGELPATGWVGLVERFGFTLAILLGFPEIAALLVGVKALGSYATRDAQTNTTPAARVLGTLSSITWALGVTGIFLVVTR